MNRPTVLHWAVEELAEALRIPVADVRLYMTDGRRISFLIERRLCRENDGWELAPSEGAAFDLLDPSGGKWEVRSLTRGGIYFTPSNQVGKGRRFDERDFIAKLSEVEGFLVSDIESFPHIPVFEVSSADVRKWYLAGKLGANAKVSRSKFLSLIHE